MDGTSARVYGGSDMLALLDNSNSSLWVPSSSPSFHETMVNFNQDHHQLQLPPSNKRPCPKPDGGDEGGGGGEDQYDMMSPYNHQEKKRRLTAEQVQFLEKSFEIENKLEPERKVQLAKELGLQPRQVAIWFQNRRARYKTKQLEKDYDFLKSSFDQLQADYDSLLKERDDLQDEVKLLTKKLKQRDMGWSNSDPDSPENPLNSDPINEDNQKVTKTEELLVAPSANSNNNNKQIEDASSAKSDVFDSEDPADSTHNNMLDPDLQSDYSQDEDEQGLMMSKNFILPTPVTLPSVTTPAIPTYNNNLVKVDQEVGCYDPNIGSAPCNFSLVEDQPFWSWLY